MWTNNVLLTHSNRRLFEQQHRFRVIIRHFVKTLLEQLNRNECRVGAEKDQKPVSVEGLFRNLSTGVGNMTALHFACATDNLVRVSILLEQGANVNAKDKHGRTPLHIASARGSKLLAELLFQRGANPRALSHNALVPLDCASDETMAALLTQIMVRAGLGEFAKERLQFLHLPGEKVRQRIMKDIDKASVSGRRTPPPFLSNLLGKSKSIVNMIWPSDSPRSSTSSVHDFSCSTESGYAENSSVESVRTDCTTASSGFASYRTKLNTPLQRRVTTSLTSEEFAAIKQHKTTRRHASDPQRMPSRRLQTPKPTRCYSTLTEASCTAVSRSLLRSPKRVSFPSDVLLDVAIINDDFVEACHLIRTRGKVDINRFGPNGLSPLHRAAIEGSCECIQLLIDQGANINIKDVFGWTPLHDAVFHGHVHCAMILIHKGAELETESNKFQTPLVFAASDEMILAVGRALVAEESGDNCSQLLQGSFEPTPDPERETCV